MENCRKGKHGEALYSIKYFSRKARPIVSVYALLLKMHPKAKEKGLRPKTSVRHRVTGKPSIYVTKDAAGQGLLF